MKAKQMIDGWEKQCCKCKNAFFDKELDGLRLVFYRDQKRLDGLMAMCKSCCKNNNLESYSKYKLREKRRERYFLDSHKDKARNAAALKYNVSDHMCSVLSCGKKCDELHHIDYCDYLAVIPLCKTHHRYIHKTNFPTEDQVKVNT